MNKYQRFLFAAVFALCSLAAFAQFGVGVCDNRFIYGDFTFLKHWEVSLEQSVFSEKPAYQYLRAYAGYKGEWKNIAYKGQAYFGAAYNGSYNSYGAKIGVNYRVVPRFYVKAILNPHHDSGYGYETCFLAGCGVVLTDNIDVIAAYTTIPEYRMSEKRLRGGFDFHVGKLSVIPEASIAVSGSSRAKTLRTVIGFRYDF